MNNIRCNQCGNIIPAGTRYCPFCGHPLEVAPAPSQNNKTLLVIIIILLALIVAVMACLLWGDKIGGLFKGKDQPREELSIQPTRDAVAKESESAVAPESAERATTLPAATPPVVKNRVANGTYRLNGAITHKENYYIDMELHVSGNRVKGRYIVYNGENVYVTLSGTIDAKGNMRLTEYKGGVATGYYFTGRFNQSVYSGKYRCTYRKLTMNFSASAY